MWQVQNDEALKPPTYLQQTSLLRNWNLFDSVVAMLLLIFPAKKNYLQINWNLTMMSQEPTEDVLNPFYHSQLAQVQHAYECHMCNQDPSSSTLGPASCLPPSRLHAAPPPTVGHQCFTDSKTPPAHPALHLYPHIHGHLPLHNFSRPLLHPTLYPPSPPLTHTKVRIILQPIWL